MLSLDFPILPGVVASAMWHKKEIKDIGIGRKVRKLSLCTDCLIVHGEKSHTVSNYDENQKVNILEPM